MSRIAGMRAIRTLVAMAPLAGASLACADSAFSPTQVNGDAGTTTAVAHWQIQSSAKAQQSGAEVSSAGFRKPVGEAYPAPDLLHRFFLRGVPITFASDAHGSGGVAARMEDLVALARSAGYGSLRAFQGRQGIDVPIAPDLVAS